MQLSKLINGLIPICLLLVGTQASYALSAFDIDCPSVKQLKQLHKSFAKSHGKALADPKPLKKGVG